MRRFEAGEGDKNKNKELNIWELLIKEIGDVVVFLLQGIDETLKEINILQNNIFISILLRDDIYNPDEERRLQKEQDEKSLKEIERIKKFQKYFGRFLKFIEKYSQDYSNEIPDEIITSIHLGKKYYRIRANFWTGILMNINRFYELGFIEKKYLDSLREIIKTRDEKIIETDKNRTYREELDALNDLLEEILPILKNHYFALNNLPQDGENSQKNK